MNIFLKILYFFTDILIPLMIGYSLRKYFSEKTKLFEKMIKWNILTFVTFLSMLSFWIIDLETRLIWLPVLGIVMQVVPGLVGFFRARKKYESSLDQGGYVLSAMLSNRGIIGMISVFILYGEEGYALVRLVMLFAGFMLYLIYFPIARHFYSIHDRSVENKRSFLMFLLNRNQTPVLGIIAGIVLNYIGVERPHVFTGLFSVLIHVSIWLYILPIGHSIDFKEVMSHLKDIREIVLIKFIITPLIIYLLGRLVGLEGMPLNTVLILSFAPTAINALVTTKIHKLNFHLAMSAYLLTTAVYLFIIYPLIFLFFELGFI